MLLNQTLLPSTTNPTVNLQARVATRLFRLMEGTGRASCIYVLRVSYHGLIFTQLPDEPARRIWVFMMTLVRLFVFYTTKSSRVKPVLVNGGRLKTMWWCLPLLMPSKTAPILHRELQMLILFHHLFQVSLSLDWLLELKLFVLDLILFLLDNCGKVGTEIFVSFHIQRPVANDALDLLLELVDQVVLLW